MSAPGESSDASAQPNVKCLYPDSLPFAYFHHQPGTVRFLPDNDNSGLFRETNIEPIKGYVHSPAYVFDGLSSAPRGGKRFGAFVLEHEEDLGADAPYMASILPLVNGYQISGSFAGNMTKHGWHSWADFKDKDIAYRFTSDTKGTNIVVEFRDDPSHIVATVTGTFQPDSGSYPRTTDKMAGTSGDSIWHIGDL